jgi:hypothetical protein|tara:strand:+ start:257 stop:439 length:183 start_codon:yes stop_codon:yes gene_type:complete
MINLDEHKKEVDGALYVPYDIAVKALAEAYSSNKSLEQVVDTIKKSTMDLNNAFKDLDID